MTRESSESDDSMTPLRIEEPVPSTAVGIESIKESYAETMSPHRRIFKWFARRPTATTRLALLASISPPEISDDELLRLMCIGPKEEIDGDIEEFVISKEATKNEREGSVEDHFGYEYAHKRLPTNKELENFHQKLKETWDGELPTVLDPTAGGGTIPFESARYGLPTISNELNPVAWLINKVILDYAKDIGSLESDVRHWSKKINKRTREEISEYFPARNGVQPDYYFRTYSIECPSCGDRFPLPDPWWFNHDDRKENGFAIKPVYGDGLSYEVVEISSASDFNPGEGTVEGGDAECPHCGVVTERDDLVEFFQSGDVEFEICGIKYTEKINGTKYHAPTSDDFTAIDDAKEKIENDLNLSTLLREDRFIGYYDRAGPYGITQWRDLFTPRQLLAHATYLKSFEKIKSEIYDQYESKEAKAILSLLTFSGTIQVNHNSRLTPIRSQRGVVDNMLGNNNFSFQWHFGESNLLFGGKSYESWTDNVVKHYEKVVNYYSDEFKNETTVLQGDASDLPLSDDSIQAVVVDPPYGDNIIYSEIADAFYVWQKHYLKDVFPDEFSQEQTNKTAEAVENPSLDDIQGGSARQRYEDKMGEIFTESYRVLEEGGVITIYFTDKEISAWDSLTMSIMDAGFTITATHTISSESPSRIGVQGQSSADTSLLLTCRKPLDSASGTKTPTLWSDIRSRTREAAQKKATSMLDSDLNLTKTDVIIGAFGPTLRVFTESYPVVDKHDDQVRPKQALEEARAAVTEVLIDRELESGLDEVDGLTRWYILSWLVYEKESIPYDEARQLGLGVGVYIDDIKQETKIWGKSRDTLVLKGEDYRVRDYTALEAGEKRRERAYPIDPRDNSFDYTIDAVHAALNVLKTKGGDFTWNWLKDRDFQNNPKFTKTLRSLLQVVPEEQSDYDLLLNLASGETGDLLGIDTALLSNDREKDSSSTSIQDF
jgi:adenine-specific DNA methylase